MKFLHLADKHGNRERADAVLKSDQVAREVAAREKVAMVIKAGDTWDATMINTEGSRFYDLVESTRQYADIAPLFILRGTPTHDVAGSLDIFRSLASKYPITVIDNAEAGQPYFVHQETGAVSTSPHAGGVAQVLVFGVPEAGKKHIMAHLDSTLEAEAAVRVALRGFFMGLGAIRRQYPQMPCVLIYHGQVGGARLDSGELLDSGSGMRPSIDDLAAVGADYIAAGDIHLPQRVGASIGLPFYYSGSMVPDGFGETHDAGGNLVEIGALDIKVDREHWTQAFDHTVTRISFGHPVNQTIRAKLVPTLLGATEIDVDLRSTVKPGARVKLEVTLTKEDLGAFTPADLEERLRIAGGAPGSIVTPNVIPTETVRAGEIATKTTLRDKVLVWGKNSKKETPETLLLKADEVQAEASSTGAIGAGSTLTLTRLVLRGAIGIWKKSGLEEVDINLESVDAGLVALIGANGAGKTTILENMHPWPELLTRSGTLQSHFRGRDAFRELHWLDEATGYRYMAKITINAAIVSGTTEYYLYEDKGAGMEPMPGIEGRKEGYVEAVERIFGSKDLYLRSAFVTQRQPKNLPDLADATFGERKKLFSALSGIDYLETFKGIAKGRGDSLDGQISTKEAEINLLTGRLPDVDQIRAEGTLHVESMETAKEDLSVLEEVGKHKAKVVEGLGVEAAANSKRADQVREAASVAEHAERERAGALQNIETHRETLTKRPAAEEVLKRFTTLTAALEVQNQGYARHLEAVAAEQLVVDGLRKEYDAKIATHRGIQEGERQLARTVRETFDIEQRKVLTDFEALRSQHQVKVNQARDLDSSTSHAKVHADARLGGLRAEVTRLETAIAAPITDHCPACRQMLPSEALEHVNQARADLKAQLEASQQAVVDQEAVVKAAGDATAAAQHALVDLSGQAPTAPAAAQYVETVQISPDLPPFVAPQSTLPPWNNAERQRISGELLFVDEAAARSTISMADQAGVRIEALTKQVAEYLVTAERERRKEAELRAELRDGLDDELAAARGSYEATKNAYRETQGRAARATAAIEQAQKRLDDLAKDLEAVQTLRDALALVVTELTEWRLLEFACSDKGIQALELDAFAPSATEIANGLLRNAFGSRYSLEIFTTRLSGTGKAQKQIEVFDIMVLDTETGESQEIGTLSGGEAVWIRRALYDAFALIRARSTNLQFLTVFQDEADGALDPVTRLTYLRMLESAHRQAGRRHTIIITHSLELQELIPTKLEVTKLKPRDAAKEAVAA